MKNATSFWLGLTALATTFSSSIALAGSMDECLLKQLKLSTPNTTVEELRTACQETLDGKHLLADNEETPFDTRAEIEGETMNEPFVISPHKPNYVLPLSFNDNFNAQPFQQRYGSNIGYDNMEVKFQISLKAPVMTQVLSDRDGIFVAYTGRSWWQAYNKDISSPFRETNHEPEIFYSRAMDTDFYGFKIRNVQLGINHQSNGRSQELSRSWNRIFASVLLEKNNFYIGLKPWYRIPEKDKESPTDPDGDDNPDISKYLGYGELNLFYKLNQHNLGMMIRNNLRKDNKGAVRLDWSFPLSERLRGYVQYYNGYGESLIDYNASTNRLSVGFMLTDWL